MFKIEFLELIPDFGESFNYFFSSGVNYVQGPNSSGKTEFYHFLDYMLGSDRKNLSESPWFKESLRAAKMQISFNGHILTLHRDLLSNEFGLVDRVGNVGVSAPTADRQTQAAPVLESGIAT